MRLPAARSLVGQMAVLIGTALLLAQLASLAYVLVERQRFNRAEIDTPAITRVTSTVADFVQTSKEFRPLVLRDASRRGAHYELASSPFFDPAKRREDTEARLRASLEASGVRAAQVRAAFEPVPQSRTGEPGARRGAIMRLAVQLTDGSWINARVATPVPPPLVPRELWVGTLLLYLIVLTASVLIALRLARPLRELTRAAEAFRGRNEPVRVQPSGPSDLRDAILAFNAMNERLVALLDEKDRTLGALGHDLRTPLTSLRIRAETVEPEEDRERMIATIDEMSSMVQDILTWARLGRSRDKLEPTDVAELAGAVAGEYREMGKPVTFTSDAPPVIDVQPSLVKRALRNLVDNALTYAGSADIAVEATPRGVAISVADHGPGMGSVELERAVRPFYRAEPSRNRDTGGAGLGLSIVQAVADAHGGTLSLTNREGGGLIATMTLPQ